MRLSLCTIALNEEVMIGTMLDTVDGLVDEIVIGVDARTNDKTTKIIREHNGLVIPFVWTDDFSAARNYVLEQTSGEWVLTLDADDRLTDQGATVIREILSRDLPYDAFSFQVAQMTLQNKVMTVQKTSPRLFRRKLRYHGVVHEEVICDNLCHVRGSISIVHYGYDPALWSGRKKHQRNLRLLRQRVKENPDDEYALMKLAQEEQIDDSGLLEAT